MRRTNAASRSRRRRRRRRPDSGARFRRRAGVAVVAAAIVAAAACALARRATPPPSWDAPRPPLVIAHRGGAALWPENTLEAFRRAVALGVDALEMDVQATADDVLVVVHDDTVDRTTDGTGAVREWTIAALRRLDAGYRWTDDAGRTFPHRGRGVTIPTLDEVLAAFPATSLVVEIKPAASRMAAAVCRAISAAGAERRVLVASFEAAALERFRAACPDVATSASADEAGRYVTLSALRFVSPAPPPVAALQLPERWRGLPVLTPHLVRAAHADGLQVHAWTINETADMRRLLDLGVDGLITDRPDRALALLGRREAPPDR